MTLMETLFVLALWGAWLASLLVLLRALGECDGETRPPRNIGKYR